MSDELLTTHEAAAVMRCHEKTVRRLIGRGVIPAVRPAGKYLIHRRDLPLDIPARPTSIPPPKPRRDLGRFGQMADEMDAA